MIEAEIVVAHATGLHARPAVQFTKLAKSFPATLTLGRPGGAAIDAKNLIKVMGLKVRHGETVLLRGEGEGAEAAVAALVQLIRDDFAHG